MMPSLPKFDARRVRSYIFRLPLCTRLLLFIIVAFYLASLGLSWFTTWGALIPQEVGLATSKCDTLLPCTRADQNLSVYRLNTYPFTHLGFIHTLLNLLALAPLLERFESEFGSLVTFLLFTGRE